MRSAVGPGNKIVLGHNLGTSFHPAAIRPNVAAVTARPSIGSSPAVPFEATHLHSALLHRRWRRRPVVCRGRSLRILQRLRTLKISRDSERYRTLADGSQRWSRRLPKQRVAGSNPIAPPRSPPWTLAQTDPPIADRARVRPIRVASHYQQRGSGRRGLVQRLMCHAGRVPRCRA